MFVPSLNEPSSITRAADQFGKGFRFVCGGGHGAKLDSSLALHAHI